MPKVCIIHFQNGWQHPETHFMVTIDESRTSNRFIRFGSWSDGKGLGDEITGWVPKDAYVIDEVLGELQEDGKTVKP